MSTSLRGAEPSASPARLAISGVGGFSAARSAGEALTRTFAAALGPTASAPFASANLTCGMSPD